MFKRGLVLTITITSVVVFGYTLVRATAYDPGDSGMVVPSVGYVQPVEAATSSQEIGVLTFWSPSGHVASTASALPTLVPEPPDRLKIASLGVDASIQRVTISSHNTIGVPTNFKDVGWYAYSPRPGQEGSSIIDGHVDNGLALAGVFKHLSDIKQGDVVSVTDHSGKRLDFTVIQIDMYPYESTSTDALSYPKSGSYLRLISCTGTWLPLHRTYDKRIVVTAELVPELVSKLAP